MSRFLVTRLAGAIGVLFALASIVFVLQSIVPGDPVRARVGANASPEVVARERHRLGLDRPLGTQYVRYIKDAVTGSLGESVRTGRPVLSDVGSFLPQTAALALAAMLIAIAGGLALGVLGATASRGAGAVRLLFVAGASAPGFMLALALIYLFYLKLGWLPASGSSGIDGAPTRPTGVPVLDGILHARLDVIKDALQHLVLPAVSLALLPAVAIGRVLRSSLLEVYATDYIRTAHAKGIRPRAILWRHALRNALSAPLTMTGLQLGLLLGGVVVVETVFAWPGIGLYTDQSIHSGDLTAIAGVTLVVGAGYVLVNVLVDLAQALADPRIRL
ncbi:MAG: ABC transporter permease [Gaiellaceae bacterium]